LKSVIGFPFHRLTAVTAFIDRADFPLAHVGRVDLPHKFDNALRCFADVLAGHEASRCSSGSYQAAATPDQVKLFVKRDFS
jgi:hypothetical protein